MQESSLRGAAVLSTDWRCCSSFMHAVSDSSIHPFTRSASSLDVGENLLFVCESDWMELRAFPHDFASAGVMFPLRKDNVGSALSGHAEHPLPADS